MLKVENLSTSYKLIDGDVHVLNDLNFEIHDNEIFGIAGESGCGKTTLLKTLYDISSSRWRSTKVRLSSAAKRMDNPFLMNPETFRRPGGTTFLTFRRLRRVF